MENKRLIRHGGGKAGGFSLIELMIVVAIIFITAAVAAPPISNWMRNYTIRGAADQVVAEIQAGRMRGIKKNVNYGVVFVVLSDNTYQSFVEDLPLSGSRQAYATAEKGAIRTLPTGVRFDTTGANDAGFRFNRLGAMCDPDTSATQLCPDIASSSISPAPSGNHVSFNVTDPDVTRQGARLNLIQDVTGLTRTIVVGFGGRARVLDR